MSELSVTNLLPLFTNQIVAKYSDVTKPKAFGRSFFTEVTTASKLTSIISERGYNLVASDVARGSRGNMNTADRYTQNLTYPPYYNEFFNITELDSYDYLRVSGIDSKVAFGMFMDEYAKMMEFCMDKIDRRYELQAWQAFQTGIVTMNNGDNISFGRKAASFEVLSGANLWTNSAADPWDILGRAATFLKETGKMSGNVINVIMGDNALKAYLKNTKVVDRAKQVQWGLEAINKVISSSTGSIPHGSISVGSYLFYIWSYTDFYESVASNGTVTKTKYLDANTIVCLPEMTQNIITYTGIPQLLTKGAPTAQKFHTWAAIDQFQDAEYAGVKSAGLAQLVAIDQLFSAQVTES